MSIFRFVREHECEHNEKVHVQKLELYRISNTFGLSVMQNFISLQKVRFIENVQINRM